ncbi:hypothetical protein BOTBODRAFT_202048 [Botryobasidium botryosum FD-172 SS1]|uniref:Uncharacterized protein n=1 Tax=Botryobasidium botryosum (strain FD-172 SS1) TaxID=930990 RepID=A0A067N0A0_BOTB1|nr:hypothetical protein BOTBODRAFT_202048 [Botryobasidium botryosum FD-172 SS1]
MTLRAQVSVDPLRRVANSARDTNPRTVRARGPSRAHVPTSLYCKWASLPIPSWKSASKGTGEPFESRQRCCISARGQNTDSYSKHVPGEQGGARFIRAAKAFVEDSLWLPYLRRGKQGQVPTSALLHFFTRSLYTTLFATTVRRRITIRLRILVASIYVMSQRR